MPPDERRIRAQRESKRAEVYAQIANLAIQRDNTTDALKDAVRRARELDVPAADLAEAIGVHRSTIYEWTKEVAR